MNDRPYLVLTGLREFWGDAPRRLFLSEWCLRCVPPSERANILSPVLPDPWDDPQRLQAAHRYLGELNERVLRWLTEYMNATHCVAHDVRYWRLLLGAWLLQLLHVAYDRYVHVMAAAQREPRFWTNLLHPDEFVVPLDTMWRLDTDRANLQLLSQLLLAMGYDFPLQRRERTAEGGQAMSRRRPATPMADAAGCWAAARRWWNAVLSRYADVAFVSMPTSEPSHGGSAPAELVAISRGSRFRAAPLALPLHWRFSLPAPVFEQPRVGLAEFPARDHFECALARLLPDCMPVLLLEGYQAAVAETRATRKERPTVLMSSRGWYHHEPFKFFAAERLAAGARLVAVQHSLPYSTAEIFWARRFETAVADAFLEWGATDGPASSAPNIRLSVLGAKARVDQRSNEILFVSAGATVRHYTDLLDSTPLGGQWAAYARWQRRFLDAVPVTWHPRVCLRLRDDPLEHRCARQQCAELFPALGWDDSATPFDAAVTRRSLVVVDHPQTALLESIGLDVPTLLFWDRSLWRMHATATAMFEELTDVGILCPTPEAAAARMIEVADSPQWWQTAAVRAARRRMLSVYGGQRDDWKTQWTRVVHREGNLAADRMRRARRRRDRSATTNRLGAPPESTRDV